MATSQNNFPKNKVTLYGVVGQRFYRQGQSDKKATEPAIRRFRNPVGGADYSVGLQVAAPYGGSYEIEVEVGPVEGAAALEHVKAGQGLVLSGYLSRTLDLDERFRLYDEEIVEGVVYQNVIFTAESVRPRAEDDPQGTGSNVAFEGTVVEPAIFFRHPDYPEIELARVGLAGRTAPVVDEQGVGKPSRPCVVSVVIPTDDEQAALLYRRGNRVQLRGVLERLATRSTRNKVVQDRLATLDSAWVERRDEIKGKAVSDEEAARQARKDLNSAGSRYVRDRDRFSRIVRTVVLAIELTPVADATPATREEATEDRTRYDAEQREERNIRRQEQRARRRDNQRREAVAKAAPTSEAAEVTESPSVTATVKHRRQPRVAEVRGGADTSIPDAELDTTEPVAKASYTNGIVIEA